MFFVGDVVAVTESGHFKEGVRSGEPYEIHSMEKVGSGVWLNMANLCSVNTGRFVSALIPTRHLTLVRRPKK